MWTIAALNKKFNDVLGTYDSLKDPHLSEHFKKPSIRHHLVRSGLVTFDGRIIPEARNRLQNNRKQQLHVLLNNLVEKGTADENDLKLFYETKQLDDLIRSELVQRAKATHLGLLDPKAQRSFEARCRSLPSASAHRGTSSSSVFTSRGSRRRRPATHILRKRKSLLTSTRKPGLASKLRPQSSYGVRRDSVSRGESTVSPDGSGFSDVESLDGESLRDSDSEASHGQERKGREEKPKAIMILRFEGTTSLKVNTFPRKVKVMQQITKGGNSFVIFNKLIRPKEELILPIRGLTLSLTVFIDEVRDVRISACCLFKHTLGSKLGHFSLVAVTGAYPCEACQSGRNSSRKRRLTPSSSSSIKPEAPSAQDLPLTHQDEQMDTPDIVDVPEKGSSEFKREKKGDSPSKGSTASSCSSVLEADYREELKEYANDDFEEYTSDSSQENVDVKGRDDQGQEDDDEVEMVDEVEDEVEATPDLRQTEHSSFKKSSNKRETLMSSSSSEEDETIHVHVP